MKFFATALIIASTSAVQLEQKAESQVTAQAFEQQLSQLSSKMEEDQKELEKMKNLWGSIKSLF